MFKIITFIFGGIAGRIRGGFIKDYLDISTTQGRLLWAATVALTFVLHTHDFLLAGSVFVLSYLGTLHGYFKGKFDLAMPENKNPRNYLWITLAAMCRTAPCALAFWWSPYADAFWFGTFAGTFAVPAGLLGVVIHRHFKFQGHTQYAEFLLYGAILMAIGEGL